MVVVVLLWFCGHIDCRNCAFIAGLAADKFVIIGHWRVARHIPVPIGT